MRLFVCTWLHPDNQAFYERRMAELIASSRGVLRAIPKSSVHVTHAFIAHADESAVDRIAGAMRRVAAQRAPIEIRLGHPSVLFAGAEARLVLAPIIGGAEAVEALGSHIVGTLRDQLPEVEISGSRSPHVTLARFRKGTRRGQARAATETLARSPAGSMERTDRIDQIQIVSSETGPTGPLYVTLLRMSLDHAHGRLVRDDS